MGGQCREHELTSSDLAMRTAASSGPVAAWRSLFQAWNGKKVLLGGDSLQDQLFQVATCAAFMMGGSVNLSNKVRVEWGPDGRGEKIVNTSHSKFGGHDGTTGDVQFVVFGASVEVGTFHFTIDYLRHYSIAKACRCGAGAGCWEAAGCGGGCPAGLSSKLAARLDSVVKWVKEQQYDRAYLNIGHDLMYAGEKFQTLVDMKARALVDIFNDYSLTGKLIFVEHPAQHFRAADGTGNYHGPSDRGCTCDLTGLSNQSVAVNNAVLARVSREKGVSVAHIWESFTSQCTRHRGPDCTHYWVSPEVWAPAAAMLRRVWGKPV